jgi:hypothetical protein
MPLYEIDGAATRRAIDAITSESVRALEECAARSEEMDRKATPPATEQPAEEDDDLSARRWMQ